MAIWILAFDNGEGTTWEMIFGTRKEALEEAKKAEYGKRYKTHEALWERITNPWNYKDYYREPAAYTIYKTDHYYTGA